MTPAHVQRTRSTSESVNRFARVLRYVWAAPASAPGMGLPLFAVAAGAKPRIVGGAVEVAGGCIDRCVRYLPHGVRFCAITFGHVIIGIDHATLARCRSHEQVHVRQY